MSALTITVNGQTQIIQLGSLSAAVNQQITQAVASATASAATAVSEAGIATAAAQTATTEAQDAAASAIASANAYSAIANGTATPAGTLTGTESVPLSRGNGLLQTTWNTVATFILTIFTILIVSGPGAVARTIIAKLLEMPVSPEDFGAVGNGTTDDTTAFTMACLASRKVRLKRGKTYLVPHLTLADLSNFELDGNGAAIVSNQIQSILGFKSVTWGIGANIYVHDLTLYYTNNPNVRTDNIFPLWFQGVNGVRVERVIVTNSWSAGVIFTACSAIDFHWNKVSNTLADGATCFGCGRDVRYSHNTFTNTGDDAMAVTWLAGNTAAAVGETTIRTKSVSIHDNHVHTTSVSARGIFIGGIEGGSIHDNKIYDPSGPGILVSNTTTVATYSTNVDVHDNVIVNAGQVASSLVGEVGGIFVYSQNLNICVHHNEVINANNAALLLQGNVYADFNLINAVTNTPSTQNPSLQWAGTGIAWADFTSSNTCYGSCNGNRIIGTINRAIQVGSGFNTQYLSICDNEFSDCVDPVSVGTAALGILYLSGTTRNQVVALRNKFFESRSTQVLQNCVYVGGGGLHDIDHVSINIASTGTQPSVAIANASGGTAIKRWAQATISTGAIAANSTFSQNVSVADAHLRDYVFVSVPFQIPGLIVSAFVQSANVVTVQVTNPTTAAITPLQGNTWTVRVRRT